jgi:1-acyl-sn-glycerol-3-phosphate acyltransferase
MKDIVKVPHTLIWRGFTVASALFFISLGYLFSRGKRRRIKMVERLWGKSVLAVGGIRLKVEGLENVPAPPVIYMANHQSDLDWPILLSTLPGDFVLLAKKELFEFPIFGKYIKFAGHRPIDRSSALNVFKALRQVAKTIKEGRSVGIFPEGTRTPDGRLGEFSLISFQVIKETGAPVVPVVIDGSFKALRKGSPIFSAATVKVKILKPFFFDKEIETEVAARQVKETISKELGI